MYPILLHASDELCQKWLTCESRPIKIDLKAPEHAMTRFYFGGGWFNWAFEWQNNWIEFCLDVGFNRGGFQYSFYYHVNPDFKQGVLKHTFLQYTLYYISKICWKYVALLSYSLKTCPFWHFPPKNTGL